MCPGGIALLQRLGLMTPQGVMTTGQKSAEGVVGEVHRGGHPAYSAPKARTVPGVEPGKWSG